MKIAVLADIHANFIALQTAAEQIEAWKPDHVIVAGDVVNRGPRPAECLSFVYEKAHTHGWRLLRGNHEDYVIGRAQPDVPRRGPAFDVHRASFWTYQRLNYDVSTLEIMPYQQSLSDPLGKEVRFVHASMRGIRDGIYPETSDESLRAKIYPQDKFPGGPPLALFCVGHTHRPLIRRLDGVLVVNAGSAGLPFDGDQRLAYAQLTWRGGVWHAEIARLEYDLAQAEQDFYTTGYLEGGGPLVKIVQLELRTASSLLYNWGVQYQERALAGEISMQDSVRQFLANIGN